MKRNKMVQALGMDQNDLYRHEIWKIESQIGTIYDELEASRNETKRLEAKHLKLRHDMSECLKSSQGETEQFTCVELIQGDFSKISYWVVQYRDGFYGWGFFYRGSFQHTGEFMYQDDAYRAVLKRESMISQGDTVMF